MEQVKNPEGDPRAEFGQWLRHELESRGYNLSQRGGGQTKFADDSGIGRATLSRILSGQGTNDIPTLSSIANALGHPLGDLLVRAGILDPSELRAVQDSPATGLRRITPEQAAAELGLTDEHSVRLFVNLTTALQRTPPSGDHRSTGH
ncbi:helix-turn-helix domain-containing protein [Streptomyces sp. NPDC017615]|uniref:helix-turn-helix domain-containing protein n=1 Tax=Streptomyces sp. NPDC017615 TaxID=3365003 RepID=UPI0037B53AA1